MMERRYPYPWTKFWHGVQPNSHGCWIWNRPHRYGSTADSSGRKWRAHRLAWVISRGEIPKGDGFHGTCVLHRCDTPGCVNPDHLFLGTNADNVQDKVQKGRARGGNGGWYYKSKTHCPQGHPYAGGNLYLIPKGGRDCRTCRTEASRRYASRRREAQAIR